MTILIDPETASDDDLPLQFPPLPEWARSVCCPPGTRCPLGCLADHENDD